MQYALGSYIECALANKKGKQKPHDELLHSDKTTLIHVSIWLAALTVLSVAGSATFMTVSVTVISSPQFPLALDVISVQFDNQLK